MMTDLSLGNGADKSRTDAFFEGVFRGVENLLAGGSTAAWRSKLLDTQFAPGQQVHTSDPIKELTGEETALAVSRSGPNSAMPSFYAQPMHALSAEEAANWNARLRQAVDDLDTGEQLRKFGQEVFDPTDKAGGYLFQKLAMPAAESAALIGSLELPGAWAPVLEMQARQNQDENYLRLRDQLGPEEANRIALVTGVANAALMKLQASVLEGFGNKFLPKTTEALQDFALSGNRLARWGVNTIGGIGAATVIGELQNHVIPAAVQDAMVNDPRFKPDWGQVWGEVMKDAPQAALGSVLLAAAGGGWQTLQQGEMAARIREFSGDRAAMLLSGYTAEQIQQIQSAESLGEKARLLNKWANQAPPAAGPERDALVSKVQDTLREEQELYAGKTENETAAANDALDHGTSIVREGAGWRVNFGEGKSVRVSTPEAALRIRGDLQKAGNQREADAMGALLDGWHEETSKDVPAEATPADDGGASQGDPKESEALLREALESIQQSVAEYRRRNPGVPVFPTEPVDAAALAPEESPPPLEATRNIEDGVREPLGVTTTGEAEPTSEGHLPNQTGAPSDTELNGEDAIKRIRMRRNGISLDVSHIRAFSSWLKKNKIEFLMDTAEVKKNDPNDAGKFQWLRDPPRIVLMEDATLYEMLHEIAHAVQFVTLGRPRFYDLKPADREQFVFNWLRETQGIWGILPRKNEPTRKVIYVAVGDIPTEDSKSRERRMPVKTESTCAAGG
jgi:hypothetical protein